ncbi:MAG TPA: cobalt ECF transporter T component CbiQ [Tepidisphaeraceae bacterium]|jgi:cobalt/nickel transport system permease protein|nr:cobalt ECF transporter T component CbiQ [Tepidisphaeraceae bacterium]
MHTHFLDTYSHLDSPIHRVGAATKTILSIAVIVTLVVSPPSWIGYAAAGIGLLILATASQIPAMFLLKRLIMLEPFVLGAASLALFQPHGVPRFAQIATRSTLCLFTLVILANTTPFSELLHVLRRARMPALMITTLALMYRYLFVLKEESARMRNARASRTFTTTNRHAWRSMTTVIAQLFIRAAGRADRVYAAMCARGWK